MTKYSLRSRNNTAMQLGDDLQPGDTTMQPGDDTTMQHVDGTTLQPGDDTTMQPGDDTTLQHGDDTTLQPGDDTTLQPGDDTTLQPGDENTLQPGDENTLQPGDENTLQPGDDTAMQPGDENTTKNCEDENTQLEDIDNAMHQCDDENTCNEDLSDREKNKRLHIFFQNFFSDPSLHLPIKVNIRFVMEDGGMPSNAIIPVKLLIGPEAGYYKFRYQNDTAPLRKFINDHLVQARNIRSFPDIASPDDKIYGLIRFVKVNEKFENEKDTVIENFAKLLDRHGINNAKRCRRESLDTPSWTDDIESAFRRGKVEVAELREKLSEAVLEKEKIQNELLTSVSGEKKLREEIYEAKRKIHNLRIQLGASKAYLGNQQDNISKQQENISKQQEEISILREEISRLQEEILRLQEEISKLGDASGVDNSSDALEVSRIRCELAHKAEQNVAMREIAVARREAVLLDHEKELAQRETSVWERERALGDMPMEQRTDARMHLDDISGTWKAERDVATHDAARDWVCLKNSSIKNAGRGVFAMVNITKGQLITRVSGKLISNEESVNLGFSRHEVTGTKNGKSYVIRMDEAYEDAEADTLTEGIGMFVNSSDFVDAKKKAGGNVKYMMVCPGKGVRNRDLGDTPAFYIEAMRDIKAGEELLVATYGSEYWRKLFTAI